MDVRNFRSTHDQPWAPPSSESMNESAGCMASMKTHKTQMFCINCNELLGLSSRKTQIVLVFVVHAQHMNPVIQSASYGLYIHVQTSRKWLLLQIAQSKNECFIQTLSSHLHNNNAIITHDLSPFAIIGRYSNEVIIISNIVICIQSKLYANSLNSMNEIKEYFENETY